jgi:hypothetical protein
MLMLESTAASGPRYRCSGGSVIGVRLPEYVDGTPPIRAFDHRSTLAARRLPTLSASLSASGELRATRRKLRLSPQDEIRNEKRALFRRTVATNSVGPPMPC